MKPRVLQCSVAALHLGLWSAPAAAQEPPPACAYADDVACPSFDLGDRFVVGLQGVKACPEGSSVITDDSTCRSAAGLTPYEMLERGEEGSNCHVCLGCTYMHVSFVEIHDFFCYV
eukprot:TRINITY_DN30576_c0_g1_i1.p1 TRINITY_DN30576_c0_g1~~TRINITY_DN30576_c0_g1_i1.p1  ORF type:complete len:116 (+),score=17.30 TRINITY_DN30576_c0_g1_i1:112-459(+)